MKISKIIDILDLARKIRKTGKTFNPLFVSPPGLGKSEIVQYWCHQNNLPFIDLRAAYLEAPDMIGVPHCEIVNGREVTKHYTPDFWPEASVAPEGVLLLDEVNRGNQSMMNCMMQLLTDRKIHKYKLPEGWIIVACINPENDTNDVNSMDTPLKDRFEIFEMEYDKNFTLKFMKNSNWDQRIINFIESGSFKYKLPEDISNSQGAKYVSPRTFSKLNAVLKTGVPDNLLYDICCSILGKNIGSDFHTFVTNQAPVTVKDLLKDEKTSLSKLKMYSNPEDYKSALISVTVKDIIDNQQEIEDELLTKVCLSLSADQGVGLIRELEYVRKDKTILDRLCKSTKKVLEHFKESLADEKTK